MFFKKRSRSVTTLPACTKSVSIRNNKLQWENHNKESVEHSLTPKKTDTALLENKNENAVESQNVLTPVYSFTTNSSDLEGILDLTAKLSDLSSNSSSSWGGDYELEVTKKVQAELEKLDRIFQNQEPSLFYDQNEIAEWKQLFPHLCILGHKTPTNSTENSEISSDSDNESILYYNSRAKTSRDKAHKQVKKTPEQTNKNVKNFCRKPKSLDIEKYLKISSMRSPEISQKRKQFSQPQVDQEEEEPTEFTSLPYLTATPVKTPSNRNAKRKNAPSKLLTLPPIGGFRSISATPRQSSSKSMFTTLNIDRDRGAQIKLKSELMKLFENLPITNR